MWLPLMLVWVFVKFCVLFMWSALLLGICVLYPAFGIFVFVGKGAEYLTRTDFKEAVFRAIFFLLFTLGFFVDFFTAR